MILISGGICAQAAPDTLITFLYVGEPAPSGIRPIAKQGFSGNDITRECSYFELLQKAKTTAQALGANVVKIDSRKERNQKQYCDEINASFYKVPDVQPFEKHISWTKDRKLVWDDFKGPVPGNAPPRNAAVTSAGIAIETNTITNTSTPKVYITNSFETGTSWVRPDHKTDAILKHEQTHFDICELYTRRMRERFSKLTITFSNLQQVLRSNYQSVMQDQLDRQQRYEEETQHGIIDEAQDRWTKMINEELSKTEAWMSR